MWSADDFEDTVVAETVPAVEFVEGKSEEQLQAEDKAKLVEALSLFADQSNWKVVWGGCGESDHFEWEPTGPLTAAIRYVSPYHYAQEILGTIA